MYPEDREYSIAARTPIPSAFARAFEDRAIFVASPATEMGVWPVGGGWGTIMQLGGYTGTITRVAIRYGNTSYTVPWAPPLGAGVELWGYGQLGASSPATKTGMNCIVKKPDGNLLNGQFNMTSKQNPGQTLEFPMLNIVVDQTGVWVAIIRYYTID